MSFLSTFTPEHCVFNGDADGLCALQQVRSATSHAGANAPRLITGVKRDIELLDRLVGTRDAAIVALDISLDKNRPALERLLAANNQVLYIDHHHAGEIPDSPLLRAHIDPAPHICTSLIVDRLLEGRYAAWAIVGAFGDNLLQTAVERAGALQLDRNRTDALQEIGMLLNYNGYGETLADLHVPPDQLAREMAPFADPWAYARESALLPRIRAGYEADMEHMRSCRPHETFPGGRVFLLPDAPWSQRVSGIFANQCANEMPDAAHAIMHKQRDAYRISVRAPKNRPFGADELCRRFESGGGRAMAAGINRLPLGELDRFLASFRQHFSA